MSSSGNPNYKLLNLWRCCFVRLMSQEFYVKLFIFHMLITEETRKFVKMHFMYDLADASIESANNYILTIV
jgi:hypothetical protein